jgi:hypothetical protein
VFASVFVLETNVDEHHKNWAEKYYEVLQAHSVAGVDTKRTLN